MNDVAAATGDGSPLGRFQVGVERPAERAAKCVDLRASEQRNREQQVSSCCGQRRHTRADELSDVVRHRKRLVPEGRIPFDEEASHLEREQRVAVRRGVHPDERRSGDRHPEPPPHGVLERSDAQGSQSRSPKCVRPDERGDVERRRLRDTTGREHADLLQVESAQEERDNRRRRRVEPLRVVHGEQHGPIRGETGDECAEARRDRPLVDRQVARLGTQQRDVECAALWAR
jgi:hypothetical protein